MATIVCGDLHGKVDFARELLSDPKQDLVFVGDLLDSFTKTTWEQIELLESVLDACETRENFTCLLGNHELSYLDEKMMCSGFNPAVAAHVLPIQAKIRQLFETYTVVHDFVITHAGISKRWLPLWCNDKSSIFEYLEVAPEQELNAIGHYRGGKDPCGGPYWCDYWTEFVPVDSIKQVFGHTAKRPLGQQLGIVTTDGRNYNIDCLDRVNEVLEISELGAKILVL